MWNILEYFAGTGLAQEPRDLVNELPVKVSPLIHLYPIKNLYSLAYTTQLIQAELNLSSDIFTVTFVGTINNLFRNVLHLKNLI